MKTAPQTSAKNKFPQGWDEKRVRSVIKHYETQSESQAAREDDLLFAKNKHSYMQIPIRLVPAVRKLMSKQAG